MAVETLKFISGQNDVQPFGSALQYSRKLTGERNEDIVRCVISVKEAKRDSK